jgi:hypothetical protein
MLNLQREHQSYIHAPKEFWSEAEAMAYKNYTVNKLLRFGMVRYHHHQSYSFLLCPCPDSLWLLLLQVKERMLGVHHDKLTSSSYHGKSLREHVRAAS